ncbi:hypothetical protein [Flaviaesturariibacter aridisoli]|uniref:DUF3035 domain-containing protein n=1 Tax=Flaviaesturariibacter aridisoli TaxID=2545761 RepID=A0A4V2WMY4_9BACT|nr:hypothetical protein [Flaviaesturariibacter aridisoli]TCZ73362.1 hypothetical protein E0486_06735 [Flaviaesturariibacter aridisoli]
MRPLCFSLLLLLTMAACSDPGNARYEQGSRILYYPRSNVYLDQDQHQYLLFDTVEQQWHRKPRLDPDQEAALGAAVTIENPKQPVYRDNAQHRLVYGTAQYTDRNALARKRVEDSLAAAPPTAAPPVEEAPKKKSRVGRWLQKIFGKKEK